MIYTDEMLDSMRRQGDPVADAVIEKLYQEQNKSIFGLISKLPTGNTAPLPASLPSYVQDFFEQTAQLPEWYDAKKAAKSAAFFSRYAQDILSMLGFISLPYCYAAADGAQVLYFSERIKNNTTKRLTETAHYVFYTFQKDAFQPGGNGIRSAQLVRLTHAAVRHHLRHHPNWNFDWGLPINQEDMAGTNLAFSLITLRGLRKINIIPSPDEADAFIHACSVSAHILGVSPELVPANAKEAYLLDQRIASRHHKPSEAGKELTQALLRSMHENITDKRIKAIIPTYMRYLLGDNIADMLAIPAAGLEKNLITPFTAINAFKSATGWQGSNEDFKHMFIKMLEKENGSTPFKIFFNQTT
jgi:hypothetical protein